ncbi:succinylglutamate desuccinylase [Paraburkholderia diazotrophica]|uniref:Succinylglutamate desuccinylase n=1 Tax=Paraburkholderia diazotrophica TaxID=667676 RepID=A0A1H6QF07_9BURK|nr:succinylglutamate desuccinylase [Paraburkholderia diazotrophica]SEI38817.1 succinylglutamate desuccinylase [Paraburkholderia diazotrophica]
MTSSADTAVPAMLDDFLAFTLAGAHPADDARAGVCVNGVQWSWIDDGVLQFEPAASSGGDVHSVLASAGIHGDETAPIELLSFLVRDIAHGRVALACRLLVILGNVQAMRESCRYIDDDLNRLFSGRHAQLPESHEAPRAAALERIAMRFFADASDAPGARWHIDMHTAIRASVFEQFALLPHTGAPLSRSMFEWLRDARIAAVLLHTTKGNTYSHFTAESCGADACTLELGKVRPFGQNDLSRFAGADHAVRQLIAGEAGDASLALPRVFTVIDQITKQSDAFELLLAKDVANFTAFGRDTVLARDGDYRYVVRHDEERIVFPNATVKPGLRAGLLVVETTDETHSVLM